MSHKNKACRIAKGCISKSLELLKDDAVLVLSLKDLVMDNQGKPRKRNELATTLDDLGATGVYMFVDDNKENPYCYIGKGGTGSSNKLKDRIGQELRLFKKSKNNNNGGTLSKNIHDIDEIEFKNDNEFKKHIAGWSLRVLHSDGFNIETELIEAFAIELFAPRYNKIGKAK